MSETYADIRLDSHESTDEVPLELYGGQEYLRVLADKIHDTVPGDRVAVMTMSLEPGEPLVRSVMQELNAAASRDVDVTLAVDAYAFLLDAGSLSVGNSLIPTGIRQQVFRQRKASLDELDAHRSSLVTVTNVPDAPFKNPFAGRSHIKGAVVNDWLSFGGPNLHDTERIDAVVAMENAGAADWFYELATMVAEEKTTRTLGSTDLTFPLDAHSAIIVDVGVPGQSAIYDRQLDVMRGATESMFLTSQFVPNGPVASTLAEGYRSGLHVETFYNDPRYWGAIGGLVQRAVLAKQMRTMTPEFRDGMLSHELPKIHAKVLGNESAASIGTHNASAAGVRFGTPEITLFRDSPEFSAAVRSLIHNEISLHTPSLEE